MAAYRIERLGHRGDGIAAGPVYAARTLPGELVDGPVEGDRIVAPKILEPSAYRVRAPCLHYKACGGCALMHAADSLVAKWKVSVVRDALHARGIAAPDAEILTSPPGARRRATFAGRRLKSGPVVGFHSRASETVTAVPECRGVRPELLAALPAMGEMTRRFGSRKGAVRFFATVGEAGVDIDVSGGAALDGPGRIALAALADTHDLARLSYDGEVMVERRPPVQRFGGAAVVPPPGAFLQATEDGEAALLEATLKGVGPARRIVDLFAGCGTFTLPLAAYAEVHAVEGDALMVAALDRGWRRAAGSRRVTTEVRDLFRRPLEPDELDGFDAAVIDPPRAGAEAQTRALAASRVPRIAAVSCNPVSFARDARILCDAGFRVDSLRIVDQFRWSPHIELAATFVRGHIPGGS